MLLIHGHYRFGKKKAVCKNEFCTHCRQPAFVEGFRYFTVLHFFFIPLIPLWFRTDWLCTRCGKDPYGRRPMSRALAVAGLICCLIGMAVAVSKLLEDDSDQEMKWTVLAIFGALAAAALYNLIRGKRRKEYLAQRAAVEPLRTDVCPYCHAPLFARQSTRCEACKVRIE